MAYEVSIDDFSQDQWERYACEFADYNIYQTWAYQQVRGEMDNHKVSRFILKDQDNRMVTMGQVRIKHVKLLGLKIGYIQLGPLFRRRNIKVEWPLNALKYLREYYLSNQVHVLRMVPNIYTNETVENCAEILTAAGFRRINNIKPYRTMLFPLDIDEDQMKKLFHGKWRAALRKAEKNGMVVYESRDVQFLRALEEIYLKSQERKRFKGLNIKEFIRTQERLLISQKMNMIVVKKADDLLTIDVNSYLGDTAVGLFQASTENGLFLGASYLAWWHTFLAAKRAGMKRYDMGGVDPDNNPHVYQFKSRMGGQEAFHIGIFEAYSSTHARVVWRTCERIYRYFKG